MNEQKRAESYQEKIGGNLHLAVEKLAQTLGESEKAVDEWGRLTEEGAKNFAGLLGVAGQEQIKAQRDIIKSTEKLQAKFEKTFSQFASRIPVIGKDLEKGFQKMMKNMTLKMDQLLTKTWGRLGAGMKGAMKIGAGGIVAAGALVLKQFHEIEKSTVELSKQTGLTGKNLKGLTTNMVAAQKSSYIFGISMQDSAEATAAMVKSLGSFRKISPDMIKTATLLAKYAGIANEEAGEFAGMMIKAFGKTSKDIMKFGNTMKEFATRSGVNSRKVMADIMQNTNLTAIYMSKGVGYLKRAAVQAAKLNMSMQDTADATAQFLDIDQSAEMVGKINQYMGSSLNSLELFNLAAKGDTEAVMKRLGQAFSSPRGIRFMEQMPGFANKFGQELGFSLKQMRVMAGLEKDHSKNVKIAATEQETIAEAVAKQQTKFQQISNTFKQAVFPAVNSLAEKLVNFTASVGPKTMKWAMAGAAVLGLGMIVRIMSRGTTPATAPWVNVVGGIGGGGGGGGGGGKGKGAFRTGYSRARGGGAGVGASMMRGASGLMAGATKGGGLMGLLKTGAKFLKPSMLLKGLRRIPVLGTVIGIVSVISDVFAALKSGNWLKIIPSILGVLGGTLGAIGGAAAGTLAMPGVGTAIGGVGGGMLGSNLGQGLGNWLIGAKKGMLVNKPTLFMAGEEGLPEMVVPTGRIARGMPINKGVADSLGGMGVPGFAGGRSGSVKGMQAQQSAATEARIAQVVQMGSMADPQTQRVRQVAYEQDVQKRKADQRDSMRRIEEKSLEILEEERSIAMDLSGPIGNFARGLGLWEKAKQAAAEYAGKTRDRFFEHLRKNNGDVMAAMQATWADTVKDLKQLQEKLYTKLNEFAGKMMNKALGWAEGKIRGAAQSVMNWGMKKLGIGNKANQQQFQTAFTGGAQALYQNLATKIPVLSIMENRLAGVSKAFQFGKATQKMGMTGSQSAGALARSGGVGGGLVNRAAARFGNLTGTSSEALGKVGQGAEVALAGVPALMSGDIAGAGKAVAGAEVKRQAVSKMGLSGATGPMAGVVKGIEGSMAGIMKGDLKMAGKGALEGGVGWALGAVATTALTPFLGPAAQFIGPMLGSIIAGPATKGILAGSKQAISGIKNIGGAMKGILTGKGGFKKLGKGVFELATSPHKAVAVAGKAIGKMLGIGRGSAGWSPDKARAKSISQMMQVQRAKTGSLITRGGIFTTKKWQQGMRKAVKMSDEGKPDSRAMGIMISDIVRTFGVTPDIAQGFIFAALGATMSESAKSDIENAITGGWGEKVKGGGWQADYQSGKLRQDWKAIRSKARGGAGDEASRIASAHQEGQRMSRVAAMSAGGFTKAELREAKMFKAYKGGGGSGIGKTGNVYLDGVLVGVVAGSAASGAAIDGIPANLTRAMSDRSWSNAWRGDDPMSGAVG